MRTAIFLGIFGSIISFGGWSSWSQMKSNAARVMKLQNVDGVQVALVRGRAIRHLASVFFFQSSQAN